MKRRDGVQPNTVLLTPRTGLSVSYIVINYCSYLIILRTKKYIPREDYNMYNERTPSSHFRRGRGAYCVPTLNWDGAFNSACRHSSCTLKTKKAAANYSPKAGYWKADWVRTGLPTTVN